MAMNALDYIAANQAMFDNFFRIQLANNPANADIQSLYGALTTAGPLTTASGVFGSAAADSITGTGVANTIVGGSGNDTITGGAGADVIDLGADVAADFVRADEGHGAVAVAGTFTAVDTVTNFITANDTFQVSGAGTSVILNGAAAAQVAGATFTAVASGAFNANGTVGGALITGATAASLTNEANVIAAIGAVANEAVGEEAYFVVANTAGTQVGVYHFVAATADNAVTAGELELIGVVTHTGAVTVADFVFA